MEATSGWRFWLGSWSRLVLTAAVSFIVLAVAGGSWPYWAWGLVAVVPVVWWLIALAALGLGAALVTVLVGLRLVRDILHW